MAMESIVSIVGRRRGRETCRQRDEEGRMASVWMSHPPHGGRRRRLVMKEQQREDARAGGGRCRAAAPR